MKHNIVRTILFATLLLSLAAVASAKDKKDKDNGVCSSAIVAGAWGYTETGWLIQPTGPIPYGSVGRLTVDRNGNVLGRRTASAAGTILTGTIVGTITVNPDCTGILTQTLTEDPPSTKPPSTIQKDIVFVNNATEAMMIVKGAAVLTVVAKKVSPDREDERD